MTREEAKVAAQIMMDYANGAEIQSLNKDGVYENVKYATFNWENNNDTYRIKPPIEYRPFKDYEECLEEMLKHMPFGKLHSANGYPYEFVCVTQDGIISNKGVRYNFNVAYRDFYFDDDTPFGKLVNN